MKFLSWNSKGLGHPSKSNALRDLINQEKSEFVLVQETKQGHLQMSKIIAQHKQYKGCACESRGASRGIAMLWHQINWSNTTETINQQWIKIVLKNNSSNQ